MSLITVRLPNLDRPIVADINNRAEYHILGALVTRRAASSGMRSDRYLRACAVSARQWLATDDAANRRRAGCIIIVWAIRLIGAWEGPLGEALGSRDVTITVADLGSSDTDTQFIVEVETDGPGNGADALD